jgi:hypothetical protein
MEGFEKEDCAYDFYEYLAYIGLEEINICKTENDKLGLHC